MEKNNFKISFCKKKEIEDVNRFSQTLGEGNVIYLPTIAEPIMWRYKNNKLNGKLSLMLLKDRKKIIGCAGVLYRKAFIISREVESAWVTDAIIDPKYYKFPFLFESLEKYCIRNVQVPVFLGFQSKKRIFDMRRKFNDCCPVDAYFFRIVLSATSYEISSFGFEIMETTFLDKRFDAFFRRVRKQYTFICDREEEFLKWRYRENPLNTYRIVEAYLGRKLVGYIIFREEPGEKKGYILDIMVDKNAAKCVYPLFLSAFKYFNKKKVKEVQCLLSSEFYIKYCLKMGFYPFEKVFSLIRITDKKLKNRYLKNKKDIHFTMGDGDYLGYK